MIYSTDYGLCPICNKRRGVAKHNKCSRILQKRHNAEEHAIILKNQKLENDLEIARKDTIFRIRSRYKIRNVME